MKHFRPRLSRRAFWVLCALLVCLRLALTGFQQAYIWVGGAPLDDELMFRAANHITAGQWLGAYDYLTLSKAMFFPVWLALLHALHLPYLISGAALWCGAALLAAFAFSTLWRKKDPAQGRVLTLGLFAALAFLPSSWAAYTLRVYRDNIFPALCLYFFAGMAGMALRAVFTPEKPLWPWLAAAGAGLACGYLDREDAGLFLLPFAAAATVIVAVVLAGASSSHQHSHLWGNVMILLCACVTSLYMVWFKRLIAKYRITTVLRWLYCTAAIVALPFGLRAIIHTDYAAIAQHALFPTLFVLIVPTYLPNLMLNYALKTVQPTVSSIYTYLQPVLAIAISVGMGLDKLHADTVIFALVIFVGVGLVLRSYTVKPRQADPPAAGPH